MKILFCLSVILCAATAFASDNGAPEAQPQINVKYKGAKDLNFEELIIEGQLKRPELGVVTGDDDENGNGLLRLRENFIDRMAADAGEEIP